MNLVNLNSSLQPEISVYESFAPFSDQDIEYNFKSSNLQKEIKMLFENLLEREISTKQRPMLDLEILETQELSSKDSILIRTSGLSSSKRKVGDGIVVFGTYGGRVPRDKDLIQIKSADFVVNTGQFGFGPKHFAIYYEPQQHTYKLLDLLQGTGTFMLLSQAYQITHNSVISFGTCHMRFECFGGAI